MQRTSGTKGSLRVAGLDSAFMALASLTLVCTLIMGASCGAGLTGALPASIEALSRVQKLAAEKRSQSANQHDLGFQQFINSKDSSDPILIGELKPNGSELEMMLLRNKIAGAIMKMQEMEKEKEKEKVLAAASTQSGSVSGGGAGSGQDQGGECYIEVTKVERVPGKCHRVNNGLPICQSENYMAINSECN